MEPGRVRVWRALGVAGLLLLMAVQLAGVVKRTSATWDEPHHLFDGYMIWTQGDYRLNPEVPPLVKLVAALPLLGRGLRAPRNHGWSSPKEAFLDGREFVFGNGAGRTLDRGRLACVVFTLGLGLLIFLWVWELWVREASGYWAGVFALAMFSFDPNFLAHGALVTTDVGSACLFVAAVYANHASTPTASTAPSLFPSTLQLRAHTSSTVAASSSIGAINTPVNFAASSRPQQSPVSASRPHPHTPSGLRQYRQNATTSLPTQLRHLPPQLPGEPLLQLRPHPLRAPQPPFDGIRVNCVAPGPIWTPLQTSGGQPDEKIPEFGSETPMRRPGQPVELAPLYVLLAGQESSYVTGEVYGATGGLEVG